MEGHKLLDIPKLSFYLLRLPYGLSLTKAFQIPVPAPNPFPMLPFDIFGTENVQQIKHQKNDADKNIKINDSPDLKPHLNPSPSNNPA